MKKILLLIMLLGFSVTSAHALSLVYEGRDCGIVALLSGEINREINIEVLSYKDNGMFELEITGGTLYIHDSGDPCIEDWLGQIKEAGDSLPFKDAKSAKATAYFDGKTLVINVSLYSYIKGEEVYKTQYLAVVVHNSYQYYFDYNENDATFKLRNAVRQVNNVNQKNTLFNTKGVYSLIGDINFVQPDKPVIFKLKDY